MNETSLSVISIFSGAGGLDLGFKNAGFKTIFATDNWDIACECLKENNLSSHIEKSDIRDLDLKGIIDKLDDNQVDCLIGGPPCPPYSKSRFYLKDKPRGLSDTDGMETLKGYIDAVREIRPKSFLFENVHGLTLSFSFDGRCLFSPFPFRVLGYNALRFFWEKPASP